MKAGKGGDFHFRQSWLTRHAPGKIEHDRGRPHEALLSGINASTTEHMASCGVE